MRKMIHIATAQVDALEGLARDTGKSFQELIDEALIGLLKKHRRPVTVKEMFTESLERGSRKQARRRSQA